MFRFLPAWECRHFPESLRPFHFHHLRCSSAATCVRNESEDIQYKKKGFNFELLLGSCTKVQTVRKLHALLVVSGRTHGTSEARLVNVYAHLGDISSSFSVFNQMQEKDTYTWNSMLSAYVRNGHLDEAVSCMYKMLSTVDVRPDFYTFPPVLKASRKLIDGMRMHCWVSKLGLEWDIFVSSSLVHMYCRFGQLLIADRIFKDMPFRDTGCWNSLISGFCQYGSASEAFKIVDHMRSEGLAVDAVTVSAILPVCAQTNDYLRGISIHQYVIKYGLELDVYVSNALINMYSKFGETGYAQKIFDQMAFRDLVSWNSVIATYEQNDLPDIAIDLFYGMQANGVQTDLLTLVTIASSIAQTRYSISGKSVHGYALRRSWLSESTVLGNAIVDMYAKLGIVESARLVFDEITIKDLVTWNTMIAGYAQNGFATEAVDLYRMMDWNVITPNEDAWVSVVPAYAHLGAVREGTKIHGQVFKRGLLLDIFVGTSLVDLYGKCGRLNEALLLFYEIPRTTSVPWNTILSCHGIHGHGSTSLELFRDMLGNGIKPDHVTFLSLLVACSHSGLVSAGKQHFHLMQNEFGIEPSMKHYGCMVDLFGRTGDLQSAYDFIKAMPVHPDASVWGALLSACRTHGNTELGKVASDGLFQVDSGNVGYYVLLSNMYANVGGWEGVDVVRSSARERGLRKTPGWSSIELNNMIEVFYTGNQSHPQSAEIYQELAVLTAKVKGLGYVPDYSFVLQDVEDDEKEHILSSHNERLAIAYGILNTPPRTTLWIFKNLRVCGDCHNITKLISKVTEREIIVRDSNRFHHFKDGFCSCGDYW